MEAHCVTDWTGRPPVVLIPSQVKPVSALRISMVPTRDFDGRLYTPEDLRTEILGNSRLKNLNFHITPHFACSAAKLESLEYAPVEFQFFDNKGEIRDSLLKPRLRTVYLFGSPYRLSVPPIRPAFSQCTRCQALGHTSTGCKAPVKCAHCAERHATNKHRNLCKDCAFYGVPAEVSCTHNFYCANCTGNHAATSVDCPLRKKYAPPTTADAASTHDEMEEDL